MEAITAVNETCATMETYATLLKQETTAIREMRMAEVTRLGDTKEALAKKLERQLMVLRHNKAVVTALGEAVMERLKTLWNVLNAAAEENMTALKRAEASTKRVIDLVVDVTKQQRQQSAIVGYGRPTNRYPTGRAPAALSVAYNNTL